MCYLNVQLAGLTGRHHPALSAIYTTTDVERLRPHIKMLSGDYLTYSRVAQDSRSENADPSCRICQSAHPQQSVPPETVVHILTECIGTADVKERLFPELLNLLLAAAPTRTYLTQPLSLHTSDIYLAQFILDCTSFNLPEHLCINHNNPRLSDIYRFARDFCYAIHSSRTLKLKTLKV